jgi:hypothetical protein
MPLALLHPAGLLFDFGLFAALLSGAALLMVALAARSGRKGKSRPPVVPGVTVHRNVTGGS